MLRNINTTRLHIHVAAAWHWNITQQPQQRRHISMLALAWHTCTISVRTFRNDVYACAYSAYLSLQCVCSVAGRAFRVYIGMSIINGRYITRHYCMLFERWQPLCAATTTRPSPRCSIVFGVRLQMTPRVCDVRLILDYILCTHTLAFRRTHNFRLLCCIYLSVSVRACDAWTVS